MSQTEFTIEIQALKEENKRLHQELGSRPSRERLIQMRAKSMRQWKEISRLNLELEIWQSRVIREQELTEEFRERMHKAMELLGNGVKEFTPAMEYLSNFDCEKYCDPSVGFHDFDCCHHQALRQWLWKVADTFGEKK